MNFMRSSLKMLIILPALFYNAYSQSAYTQPGNSGILNGFVSDRKTAEKLHGAVIIVINTDRGTTTSSSGYFELTLPSGEYSVEAKLLGYETIRKKCTIIAEEKTNLFFELDPISISTQEIPVVGSRHKEIADTKALELMPGDLKSIPQFGEADPLRALQALPGITSINDISNQLYIRGGNFDEVLLSLDDVPLYNPYHLGGMFSSLSSDIISKEKIYLSAYPQSLGGYLSGAVELSSKTGRSDAIRTGASLGIISSRGYIEGPLWKGTFFASARRTYLDVVNLFLDEDKGFPYYFYDAFAKYSIPFDEKNFFEASLFYSKDVLWDDQYKRNGEKESFSPGWGNLLINSKWTHLNSSSSSFSLQAYLSRSFMSADKLSAGTFFDNLLSDATVKFQYDFTDGINSLLSGIEYKHHSFNYNWFDNNSGLRGFINPPEEVFFDFAPNPYSYYSAEDVVSLFLTGQRELSSEILFKYGLRGMYLNKAGHVFPSASAGFDWHLLPALTLSISYGRYYQYFYTLKEKRPESLFTPFSLYFPAASPEEVASSDHYLMGLNLKNLPLDTELEVEAYYKDRMNLTSSYNDYPRRRFESGYAAVSGVIIIPQVKCKKDHKYSPVLDHKCSPRSGSKVFPSLDLNWTISIPHP